MITKILLFFSSFCMIGLLMTLSGCIKEENDLISQNCSANCTVVSGQFITNGGKSPLANMQLTLYWTVVQAEAVGGGINREKATTKTDANGNFQMKFTVRDDELSKGNFLINFNIDKSMYYLCSETSDNNNIYLPGLKRDTLVYDTYLIPYKAFLNATITNPNDINLSKGDYYGSTLTSRFKNSTCGPIILWSSQPLNPISVQANQPVYVETFKIKQGVRTTTYDTLNLSPGQVKSFSVTF